MNAEDEALVRTPTRVLRSGKRIAATPASARPAASKQKSRRAPKGATTSKKPQRPKDLPRSDAAKSPQPRLSLADKLQDARSTKTADSNSKPHQSFMITASPVAASSRGCSPAQPQEDRISFGAWVPPSPTAQPSPSTVADAAVHDIIMQEHSSQPADFAVYRSLDFSSQPAGTAATSAEAEGPQHAAADQAVQQADALPSPANLSPAAAAQPSAEQSHSMQSSAGSDGALSLESRQGSDADQTPVASSLSPDTQASSQPAGSIRDTDTAAAASQELGAPELDLTGEAAFTPAKARSDVDAAKLIESLSLAWSGPMRASAGLPSASPAACQPGHVPPSSQTTPAGVKAGLPGRSGCEGMTPQNTPALKGPGPDVHLNGQAPQPALQAPSSPQPASSAVTSQGPGSHMATEPSSINDPPEHVSADSKALPELTMPAAASPAAADRGVYDQAAHNSPVPDSQAGVESEAAAEEPAENKLPISREDSSFGMVSAQPKGDSSSDAVPQQPVGDSFKGDTAMAEAAAEPAAPASKAVRIPQPASTTTAADAGTATAQSTASGKAARVPQATSAETLGDAGQGPATGASKAGRVPQAAEQEELAALDRELAVIAAIKQEDSAFEAPKALSARSKAGSKVASQTTPTAKRPSSAKSQSVTPEGFVPRGKAGTPFLQRKLREQQAKDWAGKGKVKPHKSRLELAKEAAAQRRDSDASKVAVRRMVGQAFAKAISTQGKTLGESLMRHKSRLERDKEQAVAERKAQEAASKAAASPALPKGNWTSQGLDSTLASLPLHQSRLQKDQQAAAAAQQPHRGPGKDRSTAAPSRPSLGSSMIKHKSRLEQAKEDAAEKQRTAVPKAQSRVKTGWEGQPGLGAALPHRSKLEKDKDAWSRCAQRQAEAKKAPSAARKPGAGPAAVRINSQQPAKDQSTDSPSYLRPTRSSLRKADPGPSQPFAYIPN